MCQRGRQRGRARSLDLNVPEGGKPGKAEGAECVRNSTDFRLCTPVSPPTQNIPAIPPFRQVRTRMTTLPSDSPSSLCADEVLGESVPRSSLHHGQRLVTLLPLANSKSRAFNCGIIRLLKCPVIVLNLQQPQLLFLYPVQPQLLLLYLHHRQQAQL
jgi:hypothetical protein